MRLISGAFASAAAFVAVAAASAQDAGPVKLDTGFEVYVAYGCAQCHGTAAQGSISTPSLTQGMVYGRVLAKLRTKNGGMPRYSADILPDADVRKIAEFLGSLPPAPAATSIPALSN
jgi:mono/diheme cytochrome c family protein